MRKNKGITLIALIITIIIMLILVGVTITMLTGENGILNQGTKSVKETYHGTVKDQIILGANQYQMDKRTNQFDGDIIEYLNTNKYTTKVEEADYYRVNVETVAKNVKTGKGTTKAKGDIYVIEEYINTTTAKNTKLGSLSITDVRRIASDTSENKQYVLRYYEKEDNSKILLYLLGNGRTVEPEPTPDPDEENYDKVISVQKVEDLLDVAMYVENGQKNILIKLENDLDITNKDDYREPDKYYKNPITGNRISLDSLKEVTVEGSTQGSNDADTVNDSYPPTSSVYMELNNPGGPPSPGLIQIGSSNEKPFDGMFNGNGHTLKNIYMSGNLKFNNKGSTPKNVIGLIGYNSGTIKDLNIEDLETASDKSNTNSITNTGISNQVDTAILVANNNGVIQNCNVNIKEIAFTQTPTKTFGVIACNNAGIITECSIEGENSQLYCLGSSLYLGGIAGINNGTIENCINNISTFKLLSDGPFIAGIVGQNNDKVINCINNSTVISSSDYVAGIVGQNNKKVEKCTNTGTLSSNSFIGGIICMNNSEEEITDCINGIKDVEIQLADDSSKSYYRAGIVSYPFGQILKIKNCTNYMIINSSGPGASAIAMEPTSGVSLENIEITDCTNYGKGIGSSGVTGILFLESSKDAIVKIEKCVNNAEIETSYSSGIFKTTCNINGIVTINNCTNNGNLVGGDATGGIIGGVSISGTGKINILTSYNYGTIGKSNSSRVSGIVSDLTDVTYNIDSCENYGKIEGDSYVGGIIGYAGSESSVISNCKNKNTISGNFYVGGIIGFTSSSETKINNCINETQASIIASSYAGGIIGKASKCYITNCENNANITTSNTGYNGTGGIIGLSGYVWVNNCKNTGKITGTGSYGTGGIAGWIEGSSTETGELGFNNCFNLGEVNGKYYSAGIVGYVTTNNHNITNCGNSANITGTSYVSGIASNNYGAKIVNCYNTGNVTGDSKVSGIASNVGKSEVRNVYNTGIISTGTSTILGKFVDENISNLYSLTGVASEYITCSTSGTDYPDGTVTLMNEKDMKSQSFVNSLNANKGEYGTWVIDASNENKGYPILSK